MKRPADITEQGIQDNKKNIEIIYDNFYFASNFHISGMSRSAPRFCSICAVWRSLFLDCTRLMILSFEVNRVYAIGIRMRMISFSVCCIVKRRCFASLFIYFGLMSLLFFCALCQFWVRMFVGFWYRGMENFLFLLFLLFSADLC